MPDVPKLSRLKLNFDYNHYCCIATSASKHQRQGNVTVPRLTWKQRNNIKKSKKAENGDNKCNRSGN